MDEIKFNIAGAEELNARLKGLSYDVRMKGGRFALRKAANVIREQAIANALRFDDPTTQEQIAKNVVVRWSSRRFKKTGDLSFRVGVLGGARQYGDTKENRRKERVGATYKTAGDKSNPGGDTWYWRFKEFGVPSRGIPARPFLRSAGETAAEKAVTAFVEAYDRALDKALAANTKGKNK